MTPLRMASLCLALLAANASGCTRNEGSPSDDAATDLARRVVHAAGGDRLGRVAQLSFRFVVESGGARAMAADHRWDLRGERDRVTWTDRAGHHYDVVVDLHARTAVGTLDGAPIPPDKLAETSRVAYQRWVNDSYWLLMPAKLLDPGVERALEEPRVHGGRRYDILRLSFQGVGLTPRDRYWLYVDPRSARVERWEMILGGQSPPPKGFSWTAYRRVGPLTLAHDHASDDGTRHIRFEGTGALDRVDPAAFRVPGT